MKGGPKSAEQQPSEKRNEPLGSDPGMDRDPPKGGDPMMNKGMPPGKEDPMSNSKQLGLAGGLR